MFRYLSDFINNVFFLKNEDIQFKKIFLDKTVHYIKEYDKLYIDKIYIACEYDDNLQKSLKAFKYNHDINSIDIISGYYLELYDIFLSNYNKNDLIITGIPIFSLNNFIRGFNQTYLIGKKLSKDKNIKYLELLKKSKYTKSQAGLSKKDRLLNLKNCFKLKSSYNELIVGKTVIIIDDVISTGTTVNEVSKILKEAGVKEIIGLFLATGK